MKMETKKQPKILWPATRQYKHNDGSDGFVMGYDINVVDKIVESLQSKLTEANKTISELKDWGTEVCKTLEECALSKKVDMVQTVQMDLHQIKFNELLTPPTDTSKDDSERGEE